MPKLDKEIPGFEARDNTLRRDVKANPKDRISLEIGDSKQPNDFVPQAKVMRWDNEVNLSVRRQKPTAKGKRPTVDVVGDHVVYDDDDEAVHIYERPEVGEDGGLEIELHLKHKPASNRFDFSIQTKGLTFHYQPALTKEEVAEGAQRPDNVVGSYAVYHATKRDNRVGGMEYKTGKFCHIYRPHIIDADGYETWGELELDEQSGLLTVVVPQAFLDTAVYPVVVDPTFGYTSIGGTNSGIPDDVTGSTFAAPEDGTVDSITLYGKDADFVGGNLTTAIYDDDNADAFIANSEEIAWTAGNSEWRTLNFVGSPAISNATNYWLVVWSSAGPILVSDTVSSKGMTDASGTYNTFPDPLSPTVNNNQYSIYATYTVAPETRRRILIIS